MKRIPLSCLSGKQFYYANAPPCKQCLYIYDLLYMEDFIMYEEIFNQIRSAANKRNLKDSTIHAYCTSVAHFLNHTAKDIDALTTDDVDTFLTEKKLSGISPETYNHYHSGIRFFYKKVLKMNWDDDDIPRMKRDRKLPAVLTKAEISAILDATPNLKHKAMIATMYSGGLRVSEVTHLHYPIFKLKLTDSLNDCFSILCRQFLFYRFRCNFQ